MINTIYFILRVVLSVISVTKSVSTFGDVSLSLTYLVRFKIENKAAGLRYPSGLTLSHGRNALWTVSDKTKKVFQLNLDGELQKDKSFEIPVKGLEGITLNPTGEYLFMVKEDKNEVIKINVHTQEVTDQKPLSDMVGYNTVARYFVESPANKGLEGIAWNTHTGSIFVIKEGIPGLLIEVSSNLTTIQSHTLLDNENGFIDPETVGENLDFSGICYDENRKHFWVVSDRGQRLFLYDWKRNQVIQSFALGYATKGKYHEIKKAEGIAIDPGSNRLFVVSDKEARLYIFDIRE